MRRHLVAPDDSRGLLEIRIPTGKPGAEGGKALEALCARLPEDTVVLVMLPELEWQSLKTAWFGALEDAGKLTEADAAVSAASGLTPERRLLLRSDLLADHGDNERAFELIGFAKVSTSGEDARKLGFLRQADGVSMNPERLVGDAKAAALALASNYAPGVPAGDIRVGGEPAFALLKTGAWMAHQGGYISDYDLEIGEKLAFVLSGGRLTGEQAVSEQYLLDLEREAFLSLCGRPKTQERIQHMLKTGKPLRN